MKYRVKVFDNYCCACRGGGSDSIYTQSVEAKDERELSLICALSKFLDVNYSNREAWLKSLNDLLEQAENERNELDDEDDIAFFDEEIAKMRLEPEEYFMETNMDGADGGWECIYSIQPWTKKDFIFIEESLMQDINYW